MLKLHFERSLDSGSVPRIWTSANVSPLFKKGDKYIAANYRLVGCFGFNGPLRQYFSLYRAVSQREGERGKKG